MSQQPTDEPGFKQKFEDSSAQESQIAQAGQTVNQKQSTIYFYPPPQKQSHSSDPNEQKRDGVLEKMNTKVVNWRHARLHNEHLLNLLMQERPELIPPGNQAYRGGRNSTSPQRKRASIIEVFDEEYIAGKLLILGEPGSGKTATLMQLAKELITRAKNDPNEPVPILFNLSSWKPSKYRRVKRDKESLRNWLLAELETLYAVPRKLGLEWLDDEKLLLLLDGLDEQPSTIQLRCVKAINELFLKGTAQLKHLVVCSRRTEYETIPDEFKLPLNGVVCLQPLDKVQIEDYLLEVKYQNLWERIQYSSELLELFQSPLMLNLLISTPNDNQIFIDQDQSLNSTQAYRRALFDNYINNQFPSKTRQQARYRLIWLAKRLQDNFQTEFLIEKMQPSWLADKNERRMYRIGVGLIVGLIVGLVGALISGSIAVLIGGLIGALIGGLIGALISGLRENIRPFETLRWSGIRASWRNRNDGLISVGLGEGLIFGVISNLGITDSKNFSQISNLGLLLKYRIDVLINGVVGGLIGGSMGAFINGLGDFDDVENKVDANQGIWKSAFYAVIFALIFGIMGVLIGWFIDWLFISNQQFSFRQFSFRKFLGLMGALIGGLVPGIACIQHFMLRLILYKSNYIPWNYAHFLNYATQQGLLQRVGGRYRFIHKLLQEHLANRQLIDYR